MELRHVFIVSYIRNRGTKSGVGYGKDNIYLVVAYDADMVEFAEIFKTLGAEYALNMDGGGGTALYHNGGYKAGPGRNLPNAIIFK
jgi:exopolysaccharide biosynthesis protein